MAQRNRVIDGLIDTLQQERASNSRIQNTTTRISRLPPELLSHIFVAAVAEEASIKPSSSAHTLVALRISHVCHAWRNLAFDSSALWASVHCRVVKGKASRQAELLREWLARSKERLLSIRVSFDDEHSWINSPSKTIIHELIPYCRRWKYLDLVTPRAWFPVLQQVEGMLDNLESLSIRGTHFQARLPDFCFIAPRLKKIYLQRSPFIVLPWAQITTATFFGFSMDQIINALQHCPNLVSGKFQEMRDVEFFENRIVPPHLTLECFSISFHASIADLVIDDLFGRLALPKLRHLSLMLPKWQMSPLDSVVALINRSGCPVNSIEIGGYLLTDEETIDLIQSSTHLIRIDNHDHPFITSNDEDEDD